MPNTLFDQGLLSHARFILANQSISGRPQLDAYMAAVDIGGYYYESGIRDFTEWSMSVMLETRRFGNSRAADAIESSLDRVYSEMWVRAHELARKSKGSGKAHQAILDGCLSEFERIVQPSKPINVPRARDGNVQPVNPSGTAGSHERVPDVKEPAIPARSPLDGLLDRLRSHIGLEQVKKEVQILIASLKTDQARRAAGLRIADQSLHMIFCGNPGTGKTTIAGLVAQIYKELGVLKKGHLVCTDRAGLIANYVGQTAAKVASVVQSAIGGVLFIDEAYSLSSSDSKNDFGPEAIQQLLLMMENHRTDLVVIAAGYPREMEQFLDTNPGLRSRFKRKLTFEDYSPDQLLQIFERVCAENDYRLAKSASAKLTKHLQAVYGQRDKSFGNARYVRNLFEDAKNNLAHRILAAGLSDRASLMTIVDGDIPEPPQPAKATKAEQYLPDLGKRLTANGAAKQTVFIYASWEMDEISVVARGHYCTTRIQPLDGQIYCATFDFGEQILGEFLARAPKSTSEFVRKELRSDPARARSIQLPNPLSVGIQAEIGELQQGRDEPFVPLVITEVFGQDPTAVMEELGYTDFAENLALAKRMNIKPN